MSCEGKICLVTGANGDLGFALSKALLERKASLIISCRSASVADETLDKLLRLYPNSNIQTIVLPLHDLFACKLELDRLLATKVKIDIIINNAGIHIGKYDKRLNDKTYLTEQGFEINFQVNYLAPVLITESCVPNLSKGARIVHVFSKDYESLDKFDISNVRDNILSASGHMEYARSKLALVLYQQWCLHRMPDVQSFIATPGVTKTKLWDSVPKIVRWFMRNKFHSVELGIIPIMHCLEIENAEIGCYIGYSDNPPGWQALALNHLANNARLQQSLWQQTQSWLEE